MLSIMKLFVSVIVCNIIFLFSLSGFCAEPDTLSILDTVNYSLGELPEPWKHILPPKHYAYTNFSIVRSINGNYLHAISSGTASRLELDVNDIDISSYPFMEWSWKVDEFPETEWEMNKSDDDFAVRIELIYDYKGGKKNILNIIRKGLLTSIFKRYPPELIISYVWSDNVPFDKPYQSPESKRMIIIPIESDIGLVGRWLQERRNIKADLDKFKNGKNLVLKKIRIRSDTDNTGTVAESGIKKIYLMADKAEEEKDK